MRINLTVKAGPHEGQVFEFQERANFIVGRSERANFRLAVKDNSISRIHFMIEMNPPECRLTDMESTNGTRVNGRKVATADLKDGDLITAGKTTLLVSVIGSDEPMMSSTGTILTAEATSFDALLQPRQHAVRIAAPAGQPPATADYPPQPRPAEKALAIASSVGAALTRLSSARVVRGDKNPTVGSTWLCPACRGRIGNHPQPIPGYQVVCELGRGGMGVVYQAVRTADGELVAIKTIKPAVEPTPVEIDRFLREARS